MIVLVNGESSVLNVFAIFLPQQLYPSVDRQISQAGIIVRGFNGYDLCIYGLFVLFQQVMHKIDTDKKWNARACLQLEYFSSLGR